VRRLLPLAAAALAATGATAAIVAAPAGAATSASATPSGGAVTADAAGAAAPLPPHVFAPYFETYDTTDGGLAQLSRESGAKYLSLAFLQTGQPGSCTAYWNGDTSAPISATAPGSFGADIAAIQRTGGNVIPSFGGYGADTTNTEIADSCTSVDAIAAAYENLVRTYHVSRIDLDVEADSLNNAAGIARRNEAVAETEAWARARRLTVQFSYTLPVNPTGLTASGLAVLQNAVAEHATVSVVNIMTFDYYIGTAQNMLADTQSAAAAVQGQLQALYPDESSRALWHMIGVTEMPGIDDYGPDETFGTAEAPALLHWAVCKGIAMISFWALQRDNGNCPGTKGADNCSGAAQPTWYFSHVFEPFSLRPAKA